MNPLRIDRLARFEAHRKRHSFWRSERTRYRRQTLLIVGGMLLFFVAIVLAQILGG
jgi:hypothetical protein